MGGTTLETLRKGIDAKGKVTTQAYDSRGRRVSMTDRINATTTWTFDAAGNELSMTDAENQTTVYGYDNSGRRITIQWPDHVAGQALGGANYGIEATAYDPAGRPLRKTNQLGDTITSVYDLAGRMVSREYRTLANSPSGTTSSVDTFTYDAASRLLAATSGQYANTVGRSYSNGRLASESLTTDGQTYTTSLAYDFSVPKVTLTYPNGMAVSRSLNSRGLLSSVNMGSTTLLSRTYDAGRRLTSQTFGNGIVEAMSYRTDNLPDTRNTPVGNFAFGWDANKNKTSETITGTLSGYGWSTGTTGFDDQNRLVARNQGTGGTQLNESYTLTPVGDMSSTTTNGVAQARTHGPAHELLTIGAAALTEDSRGNIVTDGFGQTFAWDNLGHIASADTDSNGTADVTYAYDALRRRVKKTTSGEGGESLVFVSLGHDLIADYLTGATPASPQRNYAYTGRIDEPVALIDYTTAGSLSASIAEPFYYHIDANWHVRGLTNSTGAAVEAYAYSSYGTPTIIDPSNGIVRTSSSLNNRWMFTAREWDKETQTYHFRYRIYGPRYNRFTSRDPLGYPDGGNTYASWFIPVNTDPQGLVGGLGIGGPTWPQPPSPFGPKPVLTGKYRDMMKTIVTKLRAVSPCLRQATGLDGFANQLEKTANNTVSIGTSDPATAGNGSVTFPDGTLEDERTTNLIGSREDTVIHETIHVMDFQNRWNLGVWGPDNLDGAEALAYGASEVLNRIDIFNNAAKSGSKNLCDGLQASINGLSFDVFVPGFIGATPRGSTPADIRNVAKHLGLSLDCKKIAACLGCDPCVCK